jgi:septal ring factor EnvC (AmiA/AmiB activator)
MQYVQYPIIAALLVVLLVLYQTHILRQKRLKDELETRIGGLRREMASVANDVRRMADKTDAVGKEVVTLKHGLNSVTNQVVGIRTRQAESRPLETQEPVIENQD